MSRIRAIVTVIRTPTASFKVLWAGELLSMAGSLLSSFALGVWLFRDTRSVSGFALLMVASSVPGILVSPVAGAVIAHWRRQYILIGAEVLQAVVGTVLLVLITAGMLRPFHLYIAATVNSILLAVETIALQSCTAVMVPQSQLVRANALVQTGASAVIFMAPALAGMLTTWIHPLGVLKVDLTTYVIAIFLIFLIEIPETESEVQVSRRGVYHEISTAWNYLTCRRGLVVLLCTFAITRWLAATASVVLQPMVLTFASASALGGVMAAGNAGMLIGSLVLTVWGGPRGRIAGVLWGMAISGAAMTIAGLSPSVWLVGSGALLYFAGNQFSSACSEAIWQVQVPVEMQRQVFGLRPVIASWSVPIAGLTGGPLADRVFEPLLARDGPLSASLGPLIGTGRGRGMALLLICLGLAYMFTTFIATRSRQLLSLEQSGVPVEGITPPISSVAGTNDGLTS